MQYGQRRLLGEISRLCTARDRRVGDDVERAVIVYQLTDAHGHHEAIGDRHANAAHW